jgi:hypothetical protein
MMLLAKIAAWSFFAFGVLLSANFSVGEEQMRSRDYRLTRSIALVAIVMLAAVSRPCNALRTL